MKKTIVLMLILALCLSMGACGKANSKDPTGASALDKESALQGYLEVLYGEWVLATAQDVNYNPYKRLVVKEDGSCSVDGEKCTWEIDEEHSDEKGLFINILSDGKRTCGAFISSSKSFTAMKGAIEFCPGGWDKIK